MITKILLLVVISGLWKHLNPLEKDECKRFKYLQNSRWVSSIQIYFAQEMCSQFVPQSESIIPNSGRNNFPFLLLIILNRLSRRQTNR